MGCCITVPHQTVAIVEQCGAYKRMASPGLNFLNCPCGEAERGVVSLRVQQLDVRCETKTLDNVFVIMVCSVQFQVMQDRIYDAFYRLTNPQQQIKAYVFDVVRAAVPKMKLDDVFEQKDEIATHVKEQLSKAMAEFGFEIIQTLVTDVDPNHHVKAAMNEINAAQRNKAAAHDRAEADKILKIKVAEGDCESKYLAGVGIARQRKAIIDGLRESICDFSHVMPGATSNDIMDLVLVTQYFDTIKDVGAHSTSSTLFLPHSPGAVKDVADEIRAAFGGHQSMKQANFDHASMGNHSYNPVHSSSSAAASRSSPLVKNAVAPSSSSSSLAATPVAPSSLASASTPAPSSTSAQPDLLGMS